MTEGLMIRDITVGALVRWIGGDVHRLGVVVAVAANGRRVTVHFDDGESLQFALPAENLVRLIFEKGETVKLEATDERGNVADVLPADDRVLYVVSLSDGSRKTVTEDGVRLAIETDPLARMRNGELDSAPARSISASPQRDCSSPTNTTSSRRSRTHASRSSRIRWRSSIASRRPFHIGSSSPTKSASERRSKLV